MTAALFGYKYLLSLVCFVVYVVRATDTAMGVASPSGSPALTTAYPDGSHCIDPWKRHDQSCYLFMAGKYDFTEAKKRCSDQEAHLVSINDDAENEFIKTERIWSSADPAWVGLYRQTPICNHLTSCDWMWLDGNQLGYYNWPTGALPTTSQCALIEPNGVWSNGRACNTELDAICKRDVWYPTPTSAIDEVPSLEPNNKDDVGITIGCVVGVLCLIAIIVAIIILIKRRRTSSQTDRSMEEKDEETSMVAKHARTSSRTDHEVEVNDENTPMRAPDHDSNRGPPPYKDVDMEKPTVESKQESETYAQGSGHNIYTEPIRKIDRPGNEGITLQENTLYGK